MSAAKITRKKDTHSVISKPSIPQIILKAEKLFHMLCMLKQKFREDPYLKIPLIKSQIKHQDIESMSGQEQWLKLVIPALWEAEVGRSPGQEIETILANMVKPRLY